MRYYGARPDGTLHGIHLPLNFSLIRAPWDASFLARLIRRYEAAIPPGAWPSWVLGNHDRPRVASRLGPGQARLAALLLLTLRGTPTLYYGDELGMTNVAIPASRARDPVERRDPGRGFGRDPVRTPMRWSPAPGAGFTTGRPWLPLGTDIATINAASEARTPSSMLNLYRRLLALRRREPALALGDLAPFDVGGDCLAYLRQRAGRRFLVLLNLGASPRRLALPAPAKGGHLVLSTRADRRLGHVTTAVELEPVEGIVVKLG
jgi:alpha-glucosidase